MGHQPQIVPDQQIPRPWPPGHYRPQGRKGLPFPGRRKGPRKGAAFQMQCQIQYMAGGRLQKQPRISHMVLHLPAHCMPKTPASCAGFFQELFLQSKPACFSVCRIPSKKTLDKGSPVWYSILKIRIILISVVFRHPSRIRVFPTACAAEQPPGGRHTMASPLTWKILYKEAIL